MTTLEIFRELCEIRAVPAKLAIGDIRLRLVVKLARYDEWKDELEAMTIATEQERCEMLAGKFLDPNTGERLLSGDDIYTSPRRVVEALLRLYVDVNTGNYTDPDEEKDEK